MTINYHDEIQIEVHKAEVDFWTEFNHRCFARAGEELALRLPLECDPMAGQNWLETH